MYTPPTFACRACLRRTLRSLWGANVPVAQASLLRAPTSHQRQRQPYSTATTRAQSPEPALITRALKPKPEPSAKKLEWITNKHLEHLDDQYNIANHVLKTLERGAYEEALLLTQKASKDKKVTVSWNHLIDFQLKSKKLHAAVKLYNDASNMKKRAQLPNAQTYTILFRGFAASEHPKLAASEAFKIYQSMLTLDRVKPNTIHMNAVLETAAHARDIDLLFTIVDTASPPLRAPDTRTYTIILNALRHQIEPLPQRRGLTDEEHKKNVENTILRAKSVWQEVVRRWRQDKIVMDEMLACAMGRILLQGDHKDRKSVLALLGQTMQLPRLDDTNDSQSAPAVYAVPTQNTLSLVMSALRSTKNTSLAPKYWQLLTEEYAITPDRENYVRYLKALQNGRASTKTAELMPTIPQRILGPKYFRIAMQTCINDNLNKNAFQNACRIFDVMVETSRYPDAMTMRLFLHAARANFRPFQEQRETDPVGSKMALYKQVIAALDRMWEPFRVLCSSLSYPAHATTSPKQQWQETLNDRTELVAVARRMMAAVDSVVSDNGADPAVLKTLKTRNTIIRQYVSRFHAASQHMQKEVSSEQAESSEDTTA
ncbi:hypothetical protein GQ53DRAFT_779867 [Thozetella sp. PMI_491]|nr:hypothetical protein GQ53DRAFT_779867 [Thozetella sp. PMI_491]